ncbi:hypothetical protein B0H34DRAFT_734672 [Crassisporium funariophilum]|nr:hypothetical protein B0H34DRAFT_734672 [Crassisporium funariophilum]
MVSNTLRISANSHLVTSNAINNKPRFMRVRRRLRCFALNDKIVYEVITDPSSFPALFSSFGCSSRTWSISTLKLQLALSANLVSLLFFCVRPKEVGPWTLLILRHCGDLGNHHSRSFRRRLGPWEVFSFSVNAHPNFVKFFHVLRPLLSLRIVDIRYCFFEGVKHMCEIDFVIAVDEAIAEIN